MKIKILSLILSCIILTSFFNNLKAQAINAETWYMGNSCPTYKRHFKIHLDQNKISIEYDKNAFNYVNEIHMVKLLTHKVYKNKNFCDTYLCDHDFEMANNGAYHLMTDTIKCTMAPSGEILFLTTVRPSVNNNNTPATVSISYYTNKGFTDFITNNLNGKKYYSLLGESCNELSDGGGYMSYDHCLLEFKGSHVRITRYEDKNHVFIPDDDQTSKTYTYTVRDSTIEVHGLEYLPLYLKLPVANTLTIYTYTSSDIFSHKNYKFFAPIK